ncbi:MAG: hypothetical protein VX255_20710 [Candidatus Latescibacterota bacterium]|nr:hypothetical protein [Candidatus Latescibacterota bacterium]
MSMWSRMRVWFGWRLGSGGGPDERLSAFIDGELDDRSREDMAAEIALDPGICVQVQRLRMIEDLAHSALQPPSTPNPDVCAEHVLALATADTGEVAAATSPSNSRVPTAALASVGLLLTAGVAFVGLRRRGLV